ncbi:VWA domain-containing protein [Paenibacillaceae bacterium]|nr:VWA domain-containing protein [Paenibacillaceae bacterium]
MEPHLNQEKLNRWRLLLGSSSEDKLAGLDGYEPASFAYAELDELLAFLYEREQGEEQGYRREGGQGRSKLTVPAWLGKIRQLFPKQTVEIMEKQALEKYEMTEMLTDRRVLENLEPNMHLLRSIMQFKGHMKGAVVQSAKAIVRKVVDELTKSLENEVRQSLSGRRNRYRRGYVKMLKNLNVQRTITKNLKNYDRQRRKIVADQLYFNSRYERHNKWHIVIAIDESGSMLDSVIYSAVMAGIFHKLNALKTKLFIFDTQVVDLTDRLDDPVELLMSVQLGGGTHISRALRYGQTLLEHPSRTLFILVSDLEEGYPSAEMYRAGKEIIDAGCTFLVLTALDFAGHAAYNVDAARKLADMGAHVAAITPTELPRWIGKIMS